MKGVSFKTTDFHKQVVAINMNFYNFVNTVFMPTTFTSLANVLCLTKNPMSFWMDSNHRPHVSTHMRSTN